MGRRMAAVEACHSRVAEKRDESQFTIRAAVKVSPGRTVVFTARLESKAETRDEVMSACSALVDSTLKNMTPAQGILSFDCSEDGHEKGIFHFWQRYTDNRSMSRHLASPEFEAFMEKVSPSLENPIAMALYEYKDGQLGPMAYPNGPKGEGGLDDATGASKMAAGAGMQQHQKLGLAMLTEDDGHAKEKVWGMDDMLKKIAAQTEDAAKVLTGQAGKGLLVQLGDMLTGKKK